MKLLIHSYLLLTSLLFFSGPSYGGREDSLYCIEIDGQVLIPKTDPVKTYQIVLLCHNIVVDSGIVVDEESFLLRVKKNSLYTIRIMKKGYVPMVVSIDTRIPAYNSDGRKYSFDSDSFLTIYGFHFFLSLRNQTLQTAVLAKE